MGSGFFRVNTYPPQSCCKQLVCADHEGTRRELLETPAKKCPDCATPRRCRRWNVQVAACRFSGMFLEDGTFWFHLLPFVVLFWWKTLQWSILERVAWKNTVFLKLQIMNMTGVELAYLFSHLYHSTSSFLVVHWKERQDGPWGKIFTLFIKKGTGSSYAFVSPYTYISSCPWEHWQVAWLNSFLSL